MLLHKDELSTQIEGDLIALLDDYHSLPEVWDNDLDAQIHKWFANPPKVFPNRPYFSPSATNACPRELYVKAKGAKRDESKRQPHQGRWTRIGEEVGGIIQRDLLFIEKHYENMTGNTPRFRFLRTEDGKPTFEDFVRVNHKVAIEGVEYYLYGMPDGIMEYTTDEGDKLRVGLEIKSKQTTPARTSLYSMREAEESHIKQCVAYSYMYDVDYYVILYVNAAKKSWNMSDEEYAKTPDLRAFCYRITDEDRYELLANLADIQRSIDEDKPPKMDVAKWTFNNYKQATVESLTEEDIRHIRKVRDRVSSSNMPQFRKNQIAGAADEIEYMYEEIKEEGGE